MWPFFITRNVFLSKTIPVRKQEILDIIQDPEQALRISPLVFSVVQDPKDASWYTLQERLPLLGGLWESSTTFRCRWEKVTDGNNADVVAGMGTELRSEMRVCESTEAEDQCVFSEKLTVKGFCLLMPYIKSTMTNAHLSMLDIIVDKATKKK